MGSSNASTSTPSAADASDVLAARLVSVCVAATSSAEAALKVARQLTRTEAATAEISTFAHIDARGEHWAELGEGGASKHGNKDERIHRGAASRYVLWVRAG